MILATSFGFQTAMVAAAKKHPDVYFEIATGTAQSKNMAEYFGAERGCDLPVRDGGRRRDEEGNDRLHRPVPDPRGHPARERVRARCASGASEDQGTPRLDALVVRPEEGATGRREPRRSRSGRARPERRQPLGGPVRAVEGDSVGRLQLEREEVRADVLAHRGGLRLGRLLRAPSQGRDERNLEDRLLLRGPQGQVRRPRALRAEGDGQDEGGDREEEESADQRDVLSSSRDRSTTSPGSCGSRKASG